MLDQDKINKYKKEIEQAREEYEELKSMFELVDYEQAIENCTLQIFNIDDELFDGYYKSLTFTVNNINGVCNLSEYVDIYKDSEQICLFEGFKIA